MRGRVNFLGLVLLPMVLLLATAQAHHDDDRPHTLHTDSWVCVSQTVYEKAAAGQQAGQAFRSYGRSCVTRKARICASTWTTKFLKTCWLLG